MDLYAPEITFGIELDGDSHFQEGAQAYDEKRTAFISSFGIQIMRILNADIDDNIEGVLETIAREIVERRAKGGCVLHPAGASPLTPRKGGIEGARAPRRAPKRARGGRRRRRGEAAQRKTKASTPRASPSLSPPYEGGARGGRRPPSPSPIASDESACQPESSPPYEGGARGGRRRPSTSPIASAPQHPTKERSSP